MSQQQPKDNSERKKLQEMAFNSLTPMKDRNLRPSPKTCMQGSLAEGVSLMQAT